MAGYIVLWKLTEKGKEAGLKEFPQRLKEMAKDLEPSGSRHVGTWLTMGEYDGVTILDVPDDLTVARFMMRTALAGLVITHTMRALSEDEFAQVVSKLD